jgi:hypothetical protein
MAQWLRLATLIAAVKVRAERFSSLIIFRCYFFAPKFKFEFQKGNHFETNSYKTLVSITSYLLLTECT